MKPLRINLIPQAHAEALQLRRRRTIWIAALSSQILLIAGACVAARQAWPGVNPVVAAELGDAKQHISKLAGQLAQERRLSGDHAARQAMLTAILAKPDWSLLLRLIDQTVSDDIVLRQSELKPDSDHHLVLTLRGIAQSQTSVLQLADRLQHSGIFQDIRQGRIEREPFMNGSAVSFELTCPIQMAGGSLP